MSIVSSLKYLTIPAVAKHTATVIFVHGLGDTGHGWQFVAEMFGRDPDLQHVKWVLPHAPVRPVTANLGMSMPSWFDIYSFDFNTEEDETEMLRSSRQLNELISTEVDQGIEANRIVLGGFSQGGAMSLLTGLTSERKLAGLAVLSGWLPLHRKFAAMLSSHAKSTAIFWGHGSADPLVRLDLCAKSVDILKDQCGVTVLKRGEKAVTGLTCEIYPEMEHSACPEELADLKSWLKLVIPKDAEDESTKFPKKEDESR